MSTPPTLPFTGAAQRLDSAEDEPPLHASQPVDEQDAVEVIHFVLNGAREKAFRLDHALAAVAIEAAYRQRLRSRDGRVKAGHAEAAFFFELHALTMDELGIQEHD